MLDVDSDHALGSVFTRQWPEIRHVFQSPNLEHYVADKVVGFLAEKLDGSNVAVTSNNVIASRRNILLNSPTETELQNHLEQSHQKKCTKCESIFYNDEDLIAHDKDEHYHPCDKCETILASNEILEVHFKAFHIFPCNYCDFKSDEKESLSKHEEENHQSCAECEDEFTWVDDQHKCFFTDRKVTPNMGRVEVQNMYFENFTFYFI